MTKILITGANGFIGGALTHFLSDEGFQVRAAVRHGTLRFNNQDHVETVKLALGNPHNDYHSLLNGVETVIHSAAHVHVKSKADNTWEKFYQVNVRGAVELLKQAIQHDVQRFIFISTIGVNGRTSAASGNGCFTESGLVNPQTFYSKSKYEAECEIQKIAAQGQIESVILRPSLVYGPWVKANFLNLMKAISKGYPLPLRSFNPSRSILFVDNLTSAILACVKNDQAKNQLYLLCDDNPPLQVLIQMLSKSLGKKPILFYCPERLFIFMARAFGKAGMVESLTKPLLVDASKIKRELAWSPPYSTWQGMEATAKWFLES